MKEMVVTGQACPLSIAMAALAPWGCCHHAADCIVEVEQVMPLTCGWMHVIVIIVFLERWWWDCL